MKQLTIRAERARWCIALAGAALLSGCIQAPKPESTAQPAWAAIPRRSLETSEHTSEQRPRRQRELSASSASVNGNSARGPDPKAALPSARTLHSGQPFFPALFPISETRVSGTETTAGSEHHPPLAETIKELPGPSQASVELLALLALLALAILVPASIPVVGRVFALLINRVPALAGLSGLVSVQAFDALVKAIERSQSEARIENDSFPAIGPGSSTPAANDLRDHLSRELDAAHKRLLHARRQTFHRRATPGELWP